MSRVDLAAIEQVLRSLYHYGSKLLGLPNVVGIGAGFKTTAGRSTDRLGLVVLVEQKLPLGKLPRRAAVPRRLDDVTTDVLQTGRLGFVSLDPVRVSPQRPAFPGVSIGHFKVTAGTFGAVVLDRKTRRPLILSNNHILANLTNGHDGRSEIGDPILQPGRVDGGTTRNLIGWLERFVPLEINGVNKVDCALARPVSERLITEGVYGIGEIRGVREPELSMGVLKSGRSTGVNTGRVVVVNATLQVAMGDDSTVTFADQVVATTPTEGGDSGALVLDEDHRAVGLLFAGSTSVMAFNPIGPVLESLDIVLPTQ